MLGNKNKGELHQKCKESSKWGWYVITGPPDPPQPRASWIASGRRQCWWPVPDSGTSPDGPQLPMHSMHFSSFFKFPPVAGAGLVPEFGVTMPTVGMVTPSSGTTAAHAAFIKSYLRAEGLSLGFRHLLQNDAVLAFNRDSRPIRLLVPEFGAMMVPLFGTTNFGTKVWYH